MPSVIYISALNLQLVKFSALTAGQERMENQGGVSWRDNRPVHWDTDWCTVCEYYLYMHREGIFEVVHVYNYVDSILYMQNVCVCVCARGSLCNM